LFTDSIPLLLTRTLLQADDSATHIFYGAQYVCLDHALLQRHRWLKLTQAIDAAAAAASTNDISKAAVQALWQLATSQEFSSARDKAAEDFYSCTGSSSSSSTTAGSTQGLLPPGVQPGFAASLSGPALSDFVAAVHLTCLITEYGASVTRSPQEPSQHVQPCIRAVTAQLAQLLQQCMSPHQAQQLAGSIATPLAPADPAGWLQWKQSLGSRAWNSGSSSLITNFFTAAPGAAAAPVHDFLSNFGKLQRVLHACVVHRCLAVLREQYRQAYQTSMLLHQLRTL
jgi:hypothetical protein